MSKIPSILAAAAILVMGLTQPSVAGVSLNYDLQEFTSGGSTFNGSLLLISHGANNTFNSSSGWTAGTSSFLIGDDTLLAAVAISNGAAVGALSDIPAPAGSTYGVTDFTAFFIKDLDNTLIDYATGSLVGLYFGSGGGATSYSYGTYRSSAIESYGQGTAGKIAFTIPANGGTYDFWAASTGGDVSANLATSGAFSVVVPEPATSSLLLLGGLGLVALRRLRKV